MLDYYELKVGETRFIPLGSGIIIQSYTLSDSGYYEVYPDQQSGQVGLTVTGIAPGAGSITITVCSPSGYCISISISVGITVT